MKKYYKLTIEATDENTEIWLGDEENNFVQKATGVLRTSLLPGEYSVEFGLGTKKYFFNLNKNEQFTEDRIRKN